MRWVKVNNENSSRHGEIGKVFKRGRFYTYVIFEGQLSKKKITRKFLHKRLIFAPHELNRESIETVKLYFSL